MNLYKSIVCLQLPAILIILGVVSGCGLVGPHASNLLAGKASSKEVSYQSPPKVQRFLSPQSGMVICEQAQAAIAMALTGFFVDGCKPLEQSKTWRVMSVTYRDMGNGQTLWLTEVESTAKDGSAPLTRWAPIPWHDWA